MKTELQRIAIAEACGYKRLPYARYCWQCPNGVEMANDPDKILPDYLNSLDAMHEAEKVLTEDQQYDYAIELAHIVLEWTGVVLVSDFSADDIFALAHATAAQRAEAFLKTLNLWQP